MQWREMGREVGMGIGMFLLAIIVVTASVRAAFAQTETVTVDIPPQELSTALTALADQTNLQVLYASELASSQMTKGLAGTFTPQEAIRQLLEGSGLAFIFTDAKTVTLQKAPAPAAMSQAESGSPSELSTRQKPIKVPEVVVKEVRERGYVADEASSATRIPVPIQETPRSVEVVTRQVMEDQKLIRMNDALLNVSGTSQFSTQGGQGGSFMLRGFASDLNVFKNGFRDDSTFSSRTQRDIVNLERIEVVKGPPSYLYGRSDPGGVINQITKAPLRNPYYSGEMIIGSYGLYRPTIDIGGPLNESKTLTYRFNGLYESAGSYRDGVDSNRIFLAPTLGWEIGPRTSFRFEGEYLYDKAPIDRGLVAIGAGVAPIPISRFLGDPTKKNETNHGKATMTLLHDFNEMFKWRTAFRAAATRGRYSSLESWFFVGPETDGILDLNQFYIPTTVQSYYLQNELHGLFSTGPIKHKTIVGIELGREVQSAQVFQDFGGDTSTPGAFSFINIFNPNDRLFLNGPLFKSNDSKQTNNILGLYFGDHISLLENLHIHGGGRFDIFHQNLTTRPDDFGTPQSEARQTDSAFSPSVGVTYQPWKPVALFANYTESFAPQASGSRSINGELFDPERGKAYEGGVKFQALDNKLMSTIAVFDIKKKNVLTADPLNGFLFSVATGQQRSRGIEFDVAGRILPGWDIIANYAYIDARIDQDLLFQEGSRVSNAPLSQGRVWTTYFFQEGIVKGFGAGLGMFAQGSRNGVFQCQDPANCQAPFEFAGFVRMDGALYYRKQDFFDRSNLLAALNFTNILDHRYFTGTQNFREIVYTGAPFTVIGSVKLEFN